jgi:hypothetical protein
MVCLPGEAIAVRQVTTLKVYFLRLAAWPLPGVYLESCGGSLIKNPGQIIRGD